MSMAAEQEGRSAFAPSQVLVGSAIVDAVVLNLQVGRGIIIMLAAFVRDGSPRHRNGSRWVDGAPSRKAAKD